jgi:hypothetical protein
MSTDLWCIAKRHGYRIVQKDGAYTLIKQDINAVMYYYDGVSLAEIAEFFEL